jgi:hypothetical protein
MNKIFIILSFFLLVAGLAGKAFASNVSRATAAIQIIEKTYGDTYAPSAFSDCELQPGCYNALVGVAKNDGVSIGNITPNTPPKKITSSTKNGSAPTKSWGAPAKPTGKGFVKDFSLIYQVQSAVSKAGPQIAQNLANISGQLFAYLAIISLIVWVIQNLLFGDKGIKEFFVFALFIAFVRGLLAGYNLFFVGGVVNFFNQLGQLVSGAATPMATFGNVFQQVYLAIGNMTFTSKGGLLAPFLFLFTVTIDQIILIVMAAVVLGTIVVVQVYITIALITGYIFVPFMIFKPLEFLWNGWLKFLISSSLAYFMIFLVTKLLATTLTNLTAYNSGSLSSGEVMGFLLLLGIFAYLFMKIPAIAGEIVSGMPNMSVSGVASAIIGAASIMYAGGRIAGTAAKTAGQVAKAAGKGGDK